MPLPISIAFILAACILIAFGRLMVRRARRIHPPTWRSRRKRAFAWTLLFLGLLLMIVGVVTW